jgi:hypothetical protein
MGVERGAVVSSNDKFVAIYGASYKNHSTTLIVFLNLLSTVSKVIKI